MKSMRCENCRNAPERLYWRRNRRVCLNCATLNPTFGRIQDVDHVNFLDPVNQPNALGTSTQRARDCVYCGSPTYSRFKHYGPRGTKIIFACGWGHAGYWMDRKDSEGDLADGEAYVRRSLGMRST